MLVKLNVRNYDKFIDNNPNVVIIFGDEAWCEPCRLYRDVFTEVAEVYEEKNVIFGYVDLGNAQSSIEFYDGVKAGSGVPMPQTVLYKNKKLASKSFGYLTKKSLESLINDHFFK